MPIPPIGEPDQTAGDWLACVDVLPDYVAHLPVGHIVPIYGGEIWIDAYGKHFTREDFLKVHGVDPKLAWDAVKEYLRKKVSGVHKAD